MTDPDKKHGPLDPTPEHTPERPASEVPDWIESMTASPPPTERTPGVAADAFGGSNPTPQATATETFTVRSETAVPPTGTPDPSLRHEYAAPPPPPAQVGLTGTPGSTVGTDNKKVVAGILGILFGSLGIHKFYLGIQQPAIIMLCITLGAWLLTFITFFIASFVTIPVIVAMGVIGLVEGIIYLTKTDAQFRQEYEIGKRPWF